MLATTLSAGSIVQAAIPDSERQVLLAIYTQTNGAGWFTKVNWNGASGTECTWFGVSCNVTQTHVTELNLFSNNLSGPLPSLSALSEVRKLRFYGNALTALGSLSGLTLLEDFYGFDNQLTGSIPPLTGLVSLKDFTVYNNQLTGQIPSLSGLSALQSFSANRNALSGAIPSLAGLTQLQTLDISRNALSGSIPSFSGLSNLRNIYVWQNQLTGSVPSLADLTQLKFFNIRANGLSGALPPPPSPNQMTQGDASLCPNNLDFTANTQWDLYSNATPWWTACAANIVFINSFE